MRTTRRLLACSAALLLTATLSLSRASEAENPGGQHESKNEISLFLGLTDEAGHPTQLTYGLEYERRLTEPFGIGGLVDYVGGSLRNTVVAAVFFWHPGAGWKLLAAPGVEVHEGRGVVDDEHHGVTVDEDDTHFLFRLGVAYDFHVARHITLAPAVNLDLVENEHVWVYGLNLTYAW